MPETTCSLCGEAVQEPKAAVWLDGVLDVVDLSCAGYAVFDGLATWAV